MKKLKSIYCILFFVVCLCPFVGMFMTKEEASEENRKLAEFPEFQTEEGWNYSWLSEAGEYFQDHFAFRNELVTANAVINGKLLGTSTVQSVIQGTDGWLYYTDSLPDYLGTELMTDRSLFNLAHSLAIMQQYLEQKGVKFLFTVAPNKNSLYGENMPYYDRFKVSEEKNLFRLEKYLEQENVAYADLYGMLQEQEEILYHERDSHWNNKGAALVADTLMSILGKEHQSYENGEYDIRNDFEGDLDKMLYPLAMTPEDEIYYRKPFSYEYTDEIGSTFDPKISTVNPDQEGSLIMYRDSFGNALLPFMAESFGNAFFSRGVPYQLTDVDIHAADTVIVERAERFLPEMAQAPPVMTAPQTVLEKEPEVLSASGVIDVKVLNQGIRYQVSGRIVPEYLDTDTRIFVRINKDAVYEAFPMDVKVDEKIDNGGFLLYVPAEVLPQGGNVLEVICVTDEKIYEIYCNTVEEEINNEK